jgi:uncharacterized iron-regulated membrane protein
MYGVSGLGALAGGYALHGDHSWLSGLLSFAGLVALLAGLVIWLRRRDYRRLREEYRVRGLEDELGGD